MAMCAESNLIWIGEQIKGKLAYDRLLLQNMREIPVIGSIWNIIVDYTCEDPNIIDIILAPGSIQNTGSFLNFTHLNDIVFGNIHHKFAQGINVFEMLLMLPGIDRNTNEIIAWRQPKENHVFKMRVTLYKHLNRWRQRRHYPHQDFLFK